MTDAERLDELEEQMNIVTALLVDLYEKLEKLDPTA